MNWKENIYLFGNGKFNLMQESGKVLDFVGSRTQRSSGVVLPMIREGGNLKAYYWVEDLKLIARPIEDMTDEEKNEIWADFDTGETWEDHRVNYEDFVRSVSHQAPQSEVNELQEILSSHTPSTLKALYFGVYFGPQSHFKDGTVIDSREVEP